MERVPKITGLKKLVMGSMVSKTLTSEVQALATAKQILER